MKKNLTLIIFFLIFGIYNNFANSSSINSWILPFYLIKKAFPATQGKPKLEYKLLSSHYTRMV